MANTNGVEWHIPKGGQTLTTDIAPSGTGFMDIWEVAYVIDSGPAAGSSGKIRIPADVATSELVRDTIAAQVDHLHGVASL